MAYQTLARLWPDRSGNAALVSRIQYTEPWNRMTMPKISKPAGLEEDDQSDDALVARIACGDGEALRRLMRRYNQTLYRTARSILKDDAEAEDAVQDAYLLAYRAMATFRGHSRLSTWLVRIVANEAFGRLRRLKRRAEIIVLTEDLSGHPTDAGTKAEVDGVTDASEWPDATVCRSEVRRLIEARIDRLPEAFRTVFVLRAIEEMSVDETAECLGLPPATVRTRFFRARSLLRAALEHEIDMSMETVFGFAGERCDRIVAGVLAKLQDESMAVPPPT